MNKQKKAKQNKIETKPFIELCILLLYVCVLQSKGSCIFIRIEKKNC
jgi:hypothetical protein